MFGWFPDISSGRYRTWTGALYLACFGMLYFVNPATSPYVPPCPLHSITGLYCPGCGSLRASHAIMHGDIASAVSLNPMLVALAVAAMLYALGRRMKIGAAGLERRALLALPWLILAYGILRNIPLYPFNLLAPH